MHSKAHYSSTDLPPPLKYLSHQETNALKPLAKKYESSAQPQLQSPCSNTIITLKLQHDQRHFEAQKDGNPKVLGQDCVVDVATLPIPIAHTTVWSFRLCGVLHGHGG
jgi:hypothetical protein